MALSTTDKAKIRKWILTAVASGKSSIGVTIQHIKKFLDSKQDGVSGNLEMKFIIKKLLETGRLGKKDGKYILKKPKKKMPGKAVKKSKLLRRNATGRNAKNSKAVTKKPKLIAKSKF